MSGTKLTSEDAVRAATGRGWDEWGELLDAWGARGRSHGEIAGWMVDEQGVGSWWAQTVTVEYERSRGMRPRNGGRDGLFTVSASRTVECRSGSSTAPSSTRRSGRSGWGTTS